MMKKLWIIIPIMIFLLVSSIFSSDIFCRYSQNGEIYYGLVVGTTIHQLSGAAWEQGKKTGQTVSLPAVRLLHPSEPQVIIGLSGSYREAWEGKSPFKTVRWFLKPPSAAGSPGDNIKIPASLDAIKVETELVIVIGKKIKDGSMEEAKEAIFGYTVGNDIVGDADSYHSVQGEPLDQTETLLGTMLKTGDNFAIFGPFVHRGVDWKDRTRRLSVTNPTTGEIETYEHTTSNLLYSPEKAVSDISKILTLSPGDIIFTGTTAAPIAKAGDVVKVSVEGLGELENKIVK
jgi:2-keto-4-pentenoate hydratase/2-oxohepta-3-ene-1,7-dioic acid hydratase in catechol pathway